MTTEEFNFKDHEPDGVIFGKVPLWLITSDCSDGAVRLFAYFKARFGGFKLGIFPSQDTIAKDLGIKVRSVQNRLRELERVKALKSTKRGFNATNFYELAWREPFSE